eukprot:38046-Eustigmatos_ZCMA.PRE.1
MVAQPSLIAVLDLSNVFAGFVEQSRHATRRPARDTTLRRSCIQQHSQAHQQPSAMPKKDRVREAFESTAQQQAMALGMTPVGLLIRHICTMSTIGASY